MLHTARLRPLFFSTIALLLTGCITMPQGTSLNDAEPAARTVQQSVWLKPAIIQDRKARISNPIDAENTLTTSIATYARDSRRFSSVQVLPGNTRDGDHVLAFSFSDYRLQRQPHPAYFPVAILTATLYIWFNGPIYNDKSDVYGTLQVYDTRDNLLATFNKGYTGKKSVGLWSGNYAFPDGSTPRTLVVNDLLDQYQAYLLQQQGKQP